MLAAGCTFDLRDPGVTVGCGPLRYRVNLHDVSLSTAQVDAIDHAVEEFALLVGRPAEALDSAGASAAENEPGDPIVFEMTWPDDQPSGLGYAEPHIQGSSYDGGWILLNPMLRHAPVGLIRRLVLHELGHLHGLDHVDDPNERMDPSLAASTWGPGDLVGLLVTHDGGCAGSSLGAELQAALDLQ